MKDKAFYSADGDLLISKLFSTKGRRCVKLQNAPNYSQLLVFHSTVRGSAVRDDGVWKVSCKLLYQSAPGIPPDH